MEKEKEFGEHFITVTKAKQRCICTDNSAVLFIHSCWGALRCQSDDHLLCLGKTQHREARHLAQHSWPPAEPGKELSSSQPHAFPSEPFLYIEEKNFSIFSSHVTSWDGGRAECCQQALRQELWERVICDCLVELLPPELARGQSRSSVQWKKMHSPQGRCWFAAFSPLGPEWFCAGCCYSTYLYFSANWSLAAPHLHNWQWSVFTKFNADLLTIGVKLEWVFSASKLLIFELSFTFLSTAGKNIARSFTF